MGKQIWKCEQCGQKRMYGHQEPADKGAKLKINCARCHEPTRHTFSHVDYSRKKWAAA